jgi:hypothetical protein
MKTIQMLAAGLAVTALAGCGGGGGGGDAVANGISVSNCLIEEDFLVQPSQTTIDGSSPNGVNFSLRLYKDASAAKAAFAKKNAKTTALVESAVVDFKGNPSPYEGASPPKISRKELEVIGRCIDENKS